MVWSWGWGADRPPLSRSKPLAARIVKGLRVVGIPSSETTAALARRFGVPLTSFAEHRRIDVTIDGADQVERGTLNLIKGLGGALLREKIVASASDRMIVVVDETKLVDRLGRSTPLPVETVSFGWQTTLDRLSAFGCEPRLRMAGEKPFTTDRRQLHHRLHHRRDTGPCRAGGASFCHRRRCRERSLCRPGLQDRRRPPVRRGDHRKMNGTIRQQIQ